MNYSCPPVAILQNCTELEIESMDVTHTTFLFSNKEKSFRLKLLNKCFDIGPNNIKFKFVLKGVRVEFMALSNYLPKEKSYGAETYTKFKDKIKSYHKFSRKHYYED